MKKPGRLSAVSTHYGNLRRKGTRDNVVICAAKHFASETLASEPRPRHFQCLLWVAGTVPVDPATSKEAMMHHALGKQKKMTAKATINRNVPIPTRVALVLQCPSYLN